MRILTDAGLVRAKRIKGWTMYKRDEKAIATAELAMRDSVRIEGRQVGGRRRQER